MPESKRLKRVVVIVLSLAALLVLAACGGSKSTGGGSSTPATSLIKKRVLVTDRFQGLAYILDATNDTFRGYRISTGSGSSVMSVMPDKKHTIVVDGNGGTLVVVDNTTETVAGNVSLPDFTESIATSSDNKTVYAAVRNASVSGALNGVISVLDITQASGSSITSIPVPAVRRIVLSHNGSKLLAFSDNSNSVAVIDTTSKAVTSVGGFDHPVFGVFSSDDATAYILSCGRECGGTTTKVNTLTLATNAVGADVIVSGATTALLDSGNLYVAGNNGANGTLDIVSVGNMTVTKSGVAITNGYHSSMALANSRLFIGSTSCGNVSSGCLSIYNTSSSAVTNSAAGSGDVTGIQPIDGRTVVYVVEGGELVIWDTATDAPLPAAKQIDIVGQAYDVKLID